MYTLIKLLIFTILIWVILCVLSFLKLHFQKEIFLIVSHSNSKYHDVLTFKIKRSEIKY